jgi:hypothetical protein
MKYLLDWWRSLLCKHDYQQMHQYRPVRETGPGFDGLWGWEECSKCHTTRNHVHLHN